MNEEIEKVPASGDDLEELSIEELDEIAGGSGGFGDTPGLNGGDMISKVRRAGIKL